MYNKGVKMFTIADWFMGVKDEVNDLEQRQREAELDLLILMMYADRHIDENETIKIKADSESLIWENREYHIDLYIDKTIASVRNVMVNRNRLELFIKDIALRLRTQEVKNRAFVNVEKFMEIDFDISPKEVELLGQIDEIFHTLEY
jgi:hypothetical protein